MIRKFAMVLALTLLAGAIHACATVSSATGPASRARTQENPEAESTSRRKARPHDYRKWTFNAGIGANLANGTTQTFVRGGGAVGAVGVARNYSKYFGFRLDLIGANLPLRASALQLAQAPTGTDYMYGVTLDPIFNIPVGKKYTAYALVGPGFFHRAGKSGFFDRRSRHRPVMRSGPGGERASPGAFPWKSAFFRPARTNLDSTSAEASHARWAITSRFTANSVICTASTTASRLICARLRSEFAGKRSPRSVRVGAVTPQVRGLLLQLYKGRRRRGPCNRTLGIHFQ